jgi:hypothetical protein
MADFRQYNLSKAPVWAGPDAARAGFPGSAAARRNPLADPRGPAFAAGQERAGTRAPIGTDNCGQAAVYAAGVVAMRRDLRGWQT